MNEENTPPTETENQNPETGTTFEDAPIEQESTRTLEDYMANRAKNADDGGQTPDTGSGAETPLGNNGDVPEATNPVEANSNQETPNDPDVPAQENTPPPAESAVEAPVDPAAEYAAAKHAGKI